MQKTDFDTTVRPQDDFFGYVNNNWLKTNPIPPSESVWGTFHVLRDEAWKAVHDIVTELDSQKTALDQNQVLLKNFFTSAINFDKNQKNHLKTLANELDTIDKIDSPQTLGSYLGRAHRRGLSPFWTGYVVPDDRDSTVEVLRIHQAGLSLPNRDYYLEKTDRMKDIRKKYELFFKKSASLLPNLVDKNDWKAVFEIETELAKASWTDVELRNIEKNYNPVNENEIGKKYSGFDWVGYFVFLGVKPGKNLVIDQPSFLKGAISIIQNHPLDDVKKYLSWKVVNRFMGWLSKETASASFDFYGKTLGGMKEQKPLWKRAVLLADTLPIGEVLGRYYAQKHFPETSKTAVAELVEDVRKAYHTRIDRLAWMSQKTKERAHKKLDNIKVFVGYPTVWKDLSKVNLSDNNVVDNIMNLAEFDADYELEKVGQKPKDEEWEMHAHTVNAYHHPNRLEIVFPAAILQAPFFDPKASDAANLGGIGAVIGHELTHGFDDQGAQFDEHGNVKSWQTTEERKKFDELAENIVRQADAFESVPGIFLQGKLVLGEAIADVGGLELALESLRAKNGSEKDRKQLLTNFAVCERSHATPERLIELAKTDPHPPSPFRVNRVVCHADDFYETYELKPNDKLYLEPGKRARIW